jgi:hypothetical protein
MSQLSERTSEDEDFLRCVFETRSDSAFGYVSRGVDWIEGSAVSAAAYCESGTYGLKLAGFCMPRVSREYVTPVRQEADWYVDAFTRGQIRFLPESRLAARLLPDDWLLNGMELSLSTVAVRLIPSVLSAGREESGQTRQAASGIYEQANEAREFLAVTWSQLESITGISEQTFYDWGRNQRQPRPSSVRKLRRIRALIRALTRGQGEQAASEWFHVGVPSPLQEMLDGRLEQVEAWVGQVLPNAMPSEQSTWEAFSPADDASPRLSESARQAERPHLVTRTRTKTQQAPAP